MKPELAQFLGTFTTSEDIDWAQKEIVETGSTAWRRACYWGRKGEEAITAAMLLSIEDVDGVGDERIGKLMKDCCQARLGLDQNYLDYLRSNGGSTPRLQDRIHDTKIHLQVLDEMAKIAAA